MSYRHGPVKELENIFVQCSLPNSVSGGDTNPIFLNPDCAYSMKTMVANDHPIFEACKVGDYDTVAKYLAEGVSVYTESELNPMIFGIVANKGHRRILDLMIQHGLDINRPHNRFGASIAEIAVQRDSVEWLEYFVQLGVPVDAMNQFESTLVRMAAAGGKIRCLKWLLANGASHEKKDYLGGSPFFEAARNNQIVALEILLNTGADPEARDLDQNTPLIIAAKAGRFEAVEWLLDHGADI
ncbi:MAG: ankyrin repeat domain-containing protein, partial [Verrucomicrobiaceae bacterium]